MPQLTQNPFWLSLLSHAEEMKRQHLSGLFAGDPARFNTLHLRMGQLVLDYSRQRIGKETLALLCRMLEAQGFAQARADLFAGAPVNNTEGRAALHMALRAPEQGSYTVAGQPVMPLVIAARKKMLSFAEHVRMGTQKGATGKPFRHIIHVGIGGSDLGPRLLTEALADGKGPSIHFLGNVDAGPLRQMMQRCAPEETLVVLASKTFTTAETMRNAETLHGWLAHALGDKSMMHMAALTAAPEKARAYGVSEEKIFPFWEWVGGRFSVWSSVGLPAAMAMGPKAFEALLRGAASMDQHFCEAPIERNMPALMALMSLWNINALGFRARAVLPYAEGLALLPSYLQQLEMESLGKSVDRDGRPLDYATAPVVFGMTGTPAQHAFMQALHQGHDVIPAEFIAVTRDNHALFEHTTLLHAHALAQAEALAFGRHNPETAHKGFVGNRPSSLLVMDELSPTTLGQLLALYEHKVFTESVLWHINAFDQWGVELGKVLAGPLEKALRSGGEAPGIIAVLRGQA